MKKKALITGITGQDGSYLADFLLKKNYIVHGIKRKSSSFNTERIDHIIENKKFNKNFFLHYGDLTDSDSIFKIINQVKPTEIYNLGAQSHVGVSFENPIYTAEVSGLGCLRILEIIRFLKLKTKFYQATTSELFGEKDRNTKFNEKSSLNPKSPYGVSKLFAHHITKVYRESYNIYAASGMLFNHESPRRGETFVTRKITRAVGRISVGIQKKISLGNIEASRDWGFAGDYVEAMWKILNHSKSDDFVIATGETHTIKEFLEIAFDYVNLKYEDFLEISEKHFRPNEVGYLLGDPAKAKKELKWSPKTSFKDLVIMMLDHDIELAKSEKLLLDKNLLSPSWEYFSDS